MRGGCQEGGPGGFDGAPALVGVNAVRPVGRSALTPRARRRSGAPVRAAGVVCLAGGGSSVVSAGPGSGWSEVPMPGGRSAALDNRVAPECPPGPVRWVSLNRSCAQQNGRWHRDVTPWWIFVFVSSSSPAGGSPVRVGARRPGSRLAARLGNGPGRSPASKALQGGATMRSVA